MFLDEIEKDEVKYVKFCKDKIKEYFIDFFGEEYRNKIERRFLDTLVVFVDKKNINRTFCNFKNRIGEEIVLLYKKWFFKSFENIKINKKLIDEESLLYFEKMIFEGSKQDIRDSFKKIARTDYVLKSQDIKNSKKLFKTKFEDDINKLTMLNYQILEDLDKSSSKISMLDLKQNKYLAQIFDNLSDYKKQELYRYYAYFANDETSNGMFSIRSNFDKNREKMKFIILKDIRLCYQQTFVHELLHCVSTKERLICKNNNNHSLKKCGLKVSIENNEKMLMAEENGFLNEIFTDYLALNITEKMQNNGDNFLLSKLKGSSYSDCFVLVKPLFDKYINEFKHCYMDNDPIKIIDFLGEDNSDELNKLLFDFSCYSKTFLQKEISLAQTFEEGLYSANLPESPFVLPVINKYNRCFKQMEILMKKIDERQYINNNLKNGINDFALIN